MPRLSNIIGQDPLIARLRGAIENGAVGHAYLFAGPTGVGKTTTARAFARALNCSRAGALLGGPADSCDVCDACRQAVAGVHPDIHLIRPALSASEAAGGERNTSAEILISQIRDLRKQVNLSPSIGRRKVFILSPADAMNEQAQNALLKSLEEPPEACTLVLCVESAESILPTIRSRCQVFAFGAAPRMLIHQKLRELFGVSPEEAELFSALSLGKVGLALRLARDPSWMAARAGLLDLVVSVMSGPGLNALQAAESIRQAAARFPLQIESLSGDGAEAVAERLASRLQLQLVLEQTSLLLRDALLLRHSEQQDVRPLIANRDRLGEIERLARSRSPEQLQRAANVAFTAQDFLRRNANPQLLLENLLLELALPGA